MSQTPHAAADPAEAARPCADGGEGAPRGPLCTQLEVLPVEALVRLDWADLVRRYAVGVEWFDPRLFHVPEADLDVPFQPQAGVGRLPIRALVTHLADCEMVYLHRIRRAINEQTPVLGVFDEQAFFDGPLYGPGVRAGVTVAPPVAGSVAVVHTLRRWALDWLFDLDESARQRQAMHPERGAMTVRDILAFATWHLEHHARFLNAKIAHLLGPYPTTPPTATPAPTTVQAPRPGSAVASPCGPGCGCAAARVGANGDGASQALGDDGPAA
ncbi:MAG: hypothetical protein KatS3mg103_0706 [Phycisphaerales bacterium]|nr:MAG: hypothetical protein KatS3mg103_0706 [Phycisphaerales bacterium]